VLCAALAVAAIASPLPRAAAAGGSVRCPLKPLAGIPPGDSWSFTDTGAGSPYAHGRRSWANGRGSGTVCYQTGGPGGAHDVVLRAGGAAQISPGITRIGRPGTGLVLQLTVSLSDDPACALGTRATATLFASYYQGHHDSVRLHFAGGGCRAYEGTFLGQQLHVAIARNGAQVSAP